MGVACPVGNSIAYDRVGLAVSLSKPASVTAILDGSAFNLDDPTWITVDRSGTHVTYMYAGFLQPAGLTTRMHLIPDAPPSMWFGRHPASATAWFRIDFGHGNVVVTHENVTLSPGWG